MIAILGLWFQILQLFHKEQIMLLNFGNRADTRPFASCFSVPEESRCETNGEKATYAPRLSIWESDDKFQLSVDLPGVSAESIDLNIKDGMLWLSGERTFQTSEGQLRYNDRCSGAFERVVKLPDMIDPATIDAELVDGVLVVSLAKKPEAQPRKVPVRAKQ